MALCGSWKYCRAIIEAAFGPSASQLRAPAGRSGAISSTNEPSGSKCIPASETLAPSLVAPSGVRSYTQKAR